MLLLSFVFLVSTVVVAFVRAVTVHYGQIPLGLTSAPHSPVATLAAYNNTKLIPPTIPSPAPANTFTLTLRHDAAVVNGLSIPHVGGCLWGFSIEMSVISQVRKSNFLFFLRVYFIFVTTSFFIYYSWQKLVRSSRSCTIKQLKALIRLYNSSYLEVPFLNLMSNLQERCGSVPIRLGGNTQEYASLVPINSLPNGKTFSKAHSGSNATVS